MKIAVIVPCLNNFEGLAETLASVKTKYDWTPYIIPNWRENNSVAQSWNTGVRQAIADGCTHLFIVNDDIILAPQAVDNLVKHLKRSDCVMSSCCDKSGEINPLDMLTYETKEESISEHPNFSGFMITPETMEKIGWFDEGFERAYFEDNDYHYRIKLSGLKAEATTLAPFYHYGSVTQNSVPMGVVQSELFEKNRAFFTRKWGGMPGQETFKNPYNDANKTWKDL